MNPNAFVPNTLVACMFTGLQYRVIEPDKKGMAKLLNVKTGRYEPWNACNNPRFYPLSEQLDLFNISLS